MALPPRSKTTAKLPRILVPAKRKRRASRDRGSTSRLAPAQRLPAEASRGREQRVNGQRVSWGGAIKNSLVGIGLRSPHASQIAVARPQLGFLEVHAENYMAESPALDELLELRRDYPVSVHGVALSLGSSEELDRSHLDRLKALVDRVEPALVSEHLAWSAIDGVYLNDLLPLPYTESSLDLF